MLSQQITALQQSPLVWHPGTRRVDSIAWMRLELLRLQARALERALGAKLSPGLVVSPLLADKPVSINPRWVDAIVVHGD
jgi:hypothetical protein